jgi:phosphoglycolate phosphatase
LSRQLSRDVRCLVFDFDGVLVDSNALKYDAYFAVFRDVPAATPLIQRVLQNDNAGDRHDVIRSILAAMLESQLISEAAAGEHGVVARVEEYGRICEDAVMLAPETPGCSPALLTLADLCPLYINSATPEEPLRRIVARRRWGALFTDVLGRPRSKVENLEIVCERERISRGSLVFVGDSSSDQAAADRFGCPFIAFVNDWTAFRQVPARAITGLAELPLVVGIVDNASRP